MGFVAAVCPKIQMIMMMAQVSRLKGEMEWIDRILDRSHPGAISACFVQAGSSFQLAPVTDENKGRDSD